jgi:hypothetical protein
MIEVQVADEDRVEVADRDTGPRQLIHGAVACIHQDRLAAVAQEARGLETLRVGDGAGIGAQGGEGQSPGLASE